jgi:hypothetical protein
VRIRTRLLPRQIALAALVAGSALVGVHASVADPPESVLPQPAGAPAAPATRPNAPTAPRATQANSTHAKSAHSSDQPVSAVHQSISTRPRAGVHDAAKHSEPSAHSTAVHRVDPAPLPPRAARQAPASALPATRPPETLPPQRVVPPPQVKDPDARDSGPHADRTSRDRAER